jgi:hypothetical protein
LDKLEPQLLWCLSIGLLIRHYVSIVLDHEVRPGICRILRLEGIHGMNLAVCARHSHTSERRWCQLQGWMRLSYGYTSKNIGRHGLRIHVGLRAASGAASCPLRRS